MQRATEDLLITKQFVYDEPGITIQIFRGTASIEEEKQILNWVEASEENRETFLKERMLFDVSLFSTKQDGKKRAAHLIPLFRWTARIAAAIIIAVSACG